jgi:hypothetical protein
VVLDGRLRGGGQDAQVRLASGGGQGTPVTSRDEPDHPRENQSGIAVELSAKEDGRVTSDIYVWSAPRDLDADAAQELIRDWEAAGGEPAASPFEPSTDVGWFHRELTKDHPRIDVRSDAIPNPSRLPIVLAANNEPPARVVAINLPRDEIAALREIVEDVYSLAVKYDLVVYEPGRAAIHQPNREMAEYASATFWPRGAIRTLVAIAVGVVVAVVAWSLAVPLVSGGVALFAAFMVAIFVITLVAEGRKAFNARRDQPPA